MNTLDRPTGQKGWENANSFDECASTLSTEKPGDV